MRLYQRGLQAMGVVRRKAQLRHSFASLIVFDVFDEGYQELVWMTQGYWEIGQGKGNMFLRLEMRIEPAFEF